MKGCVMCFCTFRMKASVFWRTFFCSVIPFQAVEGKVLTFDKLHFLLSCHGFVAFTFIKKVIFFITNACVFTECGLTKPFLITTSISLFLWIMFRGQISLCWRKYPYSKSVSVGSLCLLILKKCSAHLLWNLLGNLLIVCLRKSVLCRSYT